MTQNQKFQLVGKIIDFDTHFGISTILETPDGRRTTVTSEPFATKAHAEKCLNESMQEIIRGFEADFDVEIMETDESLVH